jgi:hypothetical protein
MTRARLATASPARGARRAVATVCVAALVLAVAARAQSASSRSGLRGDLALLAEQGDVEQREAVLRTLREIGTARDVELALRAAAPRESGASPRLETALEQCLTALLQRDEQAPPAVIAAFAGAHESLRPCVLQALGGAKSRAALLALARIADSVPELRALALAELARGAANLAAPFDEDVAGAVRTALTVSDETVVRHAAIAAGRLEDPHCVPALIALLDSDNAALRGEALWALRQISGLRLGSDSARWNRWYETERRWRADEGAVLLRRLESNDAALCARALNELARHRLWRHEMSALLAESLGLLEGERLRLALGVLGTLQSQAAIPPLQEYVREAPRGARAAALRVLQALREPAPTPDLALPLPTAR